MASGVALVPTKPSLQASGLEGLKHMVYRHVENGNRKQSLNRRWTEEERDFLWGLLDYSTISKGALESATTAFTPVLHGIGRKESL